MRKIKTFFRMVGSYAPSNFLRILLLKIGGTKIGKNVKISFGTIVKKNVYIGDSVHIEKNVFIGSNTLIGNHVKIESDAFLYRTEIGEHTVIHKGAVLYGNDKDRLKVGRYCFIGFYALLDGSDKLEIGDFVHIAGPAVGIFTHSSIKNCIYGNQPYTEKYDKYQIKRPVTIENNVWIGGKVTIYPGVHVSSHSAILPNSVVDRDIRPNTMVGGIPAEFKKNIEIIDDEVVFKRG